jgi:hypothetical protein
MLPSLFIGIVVVADAVLQQISYILLLKWWAWQCRFYGFSKPILAFAGRHAGNT